MKLTEAVRLLPSAFPPGWLTHQQCRLHMPDKVKNILVKAISWSQFQAMALQCVIHANHDEKRLLKQLIHYLGKVTNMQNQYSNLVYVVSLSRDTFSAADITFIDVVEKFELVSCTNAKQCCQFRQDSR